MNFERVNKKAEEIQRQMSLDEKIDLLSGIDGMFTKGVPRLGVRRLRMADASMGLRDDATPATAFPASIALAATWDTTLAKAYGATVGAEFRAAGCDVLLGPGVNIYRVAQCGRNFEYFGEDPVLAAAIVVPYIDGVQSQGVSATVKHLAANNSDWHRIVSDSIVDERTLREIYLFAFEAAVKKAGVMALMTSYNKLNGEYTAENRSLVHDLLLKEWAFEGVVMSDWCGTTENTITTFNSGLHLEMPQANAWEKHKMLQLLSENKLELAELNRKVFAILRWTFAIDELQKNTPVGKGCCKEHLDTALEVARRGCVLLKNEQILPLKCSGLKLCVIGPHAKNTPTSGGGAAEVKAVDPCSILGSLIELAPDATFTTSIKNAADADAIIVYVGFDALTEREGIDRDFALRWEQVSLIHQCLKANSNTIVVITAGGGVDMDSWIDQVKGVIHAWYPGGNGAVAVAEIILGLINPSGKLPISIERRPCDAPAFNNYLPENAALYDNPDYIDRAYPSFKIRYEEGIFCGYRHYDKTGKTPLFPFGHGLSYTTFAYSDLKIEGLPNNRTVVTFKVKNIGSREGTEVAQLYIGDLVSSEPRPKRELKGFDIVQLSQGESKTLRIELDTRAFSYYDPVLKKWILEPGEFLIEVGASARDIRLNSKICLPLSAIKNENEL